MWRRSVPTPLSRGDVPSPHPSLVETFRPHTPLLWRHSVPTPLSCGDVPSPHPSLVETHCLLIERGHGGNEVSPAHIVEKIFHCPLLFWFCLFPYLYAFIEIMHAMIKLLLIH